MDLREQILSKDDRPLSPVRVPEWDCTVYVRVLSAGERERWELESDRYRSSALVRAAMAVASACDETGRAIFTPADVVPLAEKSAPALCRIFDKAIEVNKVSPEDVAALEGN